MMSLMGANSMMGAGGANGMMGALWLLLDHHGHLATMKSDRIDSSAAEDIALVAVSSARKIFSDTPNWLRVSKRGTVQ